MSKYERNYVPHIFLTNPDCYRDVGSNVLQVLATEPKHAIAVSPFLYAAHHLVWMDEEGEMQWRT